MIISHFCALQVCVNTIPFCNTQNGTLFSIYVHFVHYKTMFANCSRTSRTNTNKFTIVLERTRTIIPELELETNSTHYSRTRDEQALNLIREEIFCSCSCSWFGSHIWRHGGQLASVHQRYLKSSQKSHNSQRN